MFGYNWDWRKCSNRKFEFSYPSDKLFKVLTEEMIIEQKETQLMEGTMNEVGCNSCENCTIWLRNGHYYLNLSCRQNRLNGLCVIRNQKKTRIQISKSTVLKQNISMWNKPKVLCDNGGTVMQLVKYQEKDIITTTTTGATTTDTITTGTITTGTITTGTTKTTTTTTTITTTTTTTTSVTITSSW
ncbi:hypothetical protein SNEBB_008768 [Seison nebaliae]|nr:hypothetical protein SNEBB_008768 [Seison nebaliae]